MIKTKIFAAYLPQYHETEDNNTFWGKGYTDWCAVKKAVPLFEGHEQPKVPYGNNYYDLADVANIEKQANLAKSYGIDGFNIYHYWFKDGRQSLETPAELLLSHPEIDISYFFTWDNGSWKRTWSNLSGNDWAPNFEMNTQIGQQEPSAEEKTGILIEFAYQGKEQWKKHFEYLTPFFKDSRYLKIDNKPVFMFFSRERDEIVQMREYWNELAKDIGFSGVYICTQKTFFLKAKNVDAEFLYQPTYSSWGLVHKTVGVLGKYINCKWYTDSLKIYNYEKCWKQILRDTRRFIKKDIIPGSFVGYDDTPRRGKKGRVIAGKTPELFKEYFSRLYKMCCDNDKKIMLITAWNEWGEGAYLEPDTESGHAYLNVVKEIVNREEI